ncbi:MAG: DHH family phosphoesterase [archaeon]
MLTNKQIGEIREHLEKAQNPVFFYDNDNDGLCSFLLLRRMLGRGTGIVVKNYPDLNAQYAKKAQDLNADYIFVLDKPEIAQEFLDEIGMLHIPVIWIDHHDSKELKSENLILYNPVKNKGNDKSSEPVTYLSYKIAGNTGDIWIAMIGCISDHYLPDFAEDFSKAYPEFWGEVKMPFDAYYGTELGRVARSLNFGLKDTPAHVKDLQNLLLGMRGPDQVLSELEGDHAFSERYRALKEKYEILLKKAESELDRNLLFFAYGGFECLNADLSNELSHRYKGKYVAVAYVKAGEAKISMRGKNVRAILEKLLKNFQNCRGGGHEDAVGASLQADDLPKFRELMENEVNKK